MTARHPVGMTLIKIRTLDDTIAAIPLDNFRVVKPHGPNYIIQTNESSISHHVSKEVALEIIDTINAAVNLAI